MTKKLAFNPAKVVLKLALVVGALCAIEDASIGSGLAGFFFVVLVATPVLFMGGLLCFFADFDIGPEDLFKRHAFAITVEGVDE